MSYYFLAKTVGTILHRKNMFEKIRDFRINIPELKK